LISEELNTGLLGTCFGDILVASNFGEITKLVGNRLAHALENHGQGVLACCGLKLVEIRAVLNLVGGPIDEGMSVLIEFDFRGGELQPRLGRLGRRSTKRLRAG